MNLKRIIAALIDCRIWITDHADEEAEADYLSFDEIYHSVLYGEIIENYPMNQPYPRFLISGENFAHEPIHSVWDYDQESDTAILVTVYRPDPRRCIDYKIRRY